MDHNPNLGDFKGVSPSDHGRSRPKRTNENVASVAGKKFYLPFKRGMWWVRPGSSFLARMMDLTHVRRVRYYSLLKVDDVSVLPDNIRKWARERMYLSTYNPNAGPDLPEGMDFQPDERWEVVPGQAVLTAGAMKVILQEENQSWFVKDYTPYHLHSDFPWPHGRPLKEMQFASETYIAQALSDPIGAHLAREIDRRVPAKERSVRARDVYMMPLYSMVWLSYQPHSNPNYSGKMFTPNDPMSRPGKGEVSIRQGMSWVECAPAPNSSSYTTWSNFQRYAFDVWKLCGSCGTSGENFGLLDNPRLDIKGPFHCPSCGCVPVDPVDGEPMDERFVAGLDDRTLMLKANTTIKCSGCGKKVNPRPKVDCPRCGDEGRPTGLDEVLTRVSVYESGSTRIYDFAVEDIPNHPLHLSWDKLQAYSPRNSRANNFPSNLAEAFPGSLALTEFSDFLLLKPDDQVKLLGSDIYDPLNHRAEVRR